MIVHNSVPPRDPNQLPPGVSDDVGKHPEGEWNDDSDSTEEDEAGNNGTGDDEDDD